eukprot:3075784-Pleurochrysis_carterae.AAC.1
MEPISLTERVTPLATLSRMLGFHALRDDAFGGKEAAFGTRRACRAAVDECSSRAAGGARRSSPVGRRSSRYGDAWHQTCGLEKK